MPFKAPAGHVLHGQCAHCKTPLDPHTTEDKHAATFGALHCPGCGCCFKPSGKLRWPHPSCPADRAEHEFARLDD